MERFEVTQKLLTMGPVYEVHAQGRSETIATIRGKVLSATPKLTMVEGKEGADIAYLSGNFMKTKYEVAGKDRRALATLAFPMLTLKRRFALSVGDKQYKADGGFLGGDFRCTNDAGDAVLVIAKKLALKDSFAVQVAATIPRDVALLCAVAIDQRFFGDD